LETREVPATITVTSAADAGAGTLREAITKANMTNAADTINFNIPGGPTATIYLKTALPQITHTLTIDGTSQSNATYPAIALDGSQATQDISAGLDLAAVCTVKGFAIGNFAKGAGILVEAANAKILHCHVGTDIFGVQAAPNYVGIKIAGDGATLDYN